MRAELESLAADLTAAWNSGERIPRPAEAARPRTRAEAYAVQDRMAELIGGQAVGWKIGAALPAVQIAEGHDGPLYGRLFADRVFTSEARLPARLFADYNAEMEYAFRLKQAIGKRGTPYTREEIAALVDFVPGVEIAGSRFQTGPGPGGTFVGIADNGSGGAFVFGEAIADWRGIDLDGLALEGSVPGRVAEIYRGELRGDVVAVLTGMVNDLLERGIPLSKGDYLSTGSLIVPLPLPKGAVFTARFGDITTLRVTIA